MAGVSTIPGEQLPVSASALSPLAREQYAALARARWVIFRSGFRTTRGAMETSAQTATSVLFGVMGLSVASGLGFAAGFIASGGKWEFMPIVFWAMFVIWQVVPIATASFQQQYDFRDLLRFPVAYSTFFVLNLVFGLIDSSTIIGGFCALGVWIGITIVRLHLSAWAAVVLLVFSAFNIFLVRAIFAWIDRWLAQRRTREIVMAVFFALTIGVQVFNPAYRQSFSHDSHKVRLDKDTVRWIRTAAGVQRWLPPGLASGALAETSARNPAQAVIALGLLGGFVFVTGGALAARLRAEYRGESLGEAPARKKVERRKGQWLLDGSGPIAALMEKDFRTMTRAVPLLYALGAPLLMVFLFSGMFRRQAAGPGHAPLAMLLSLAYAIVGFTQLFYNNLGTEGPGIQMLFLSPTPFRTVMLAKNLLHSALFAIVASLVCVVATLRMGAPEGVVWLITLSWLLFALPVHLTAGNIFSLMMPYRINLGRIGRQRGSQMSALLSVLIQLVVAGLGAGVFALTSWWGKTWVSAPIFLVLAAGAIFAWTRVLANADRIALNHRDELIATLVKAE